MYNIAVCRLSALQVLVAAAQASGPSTATQGAPNEPSDGAELLQALWLKFVQFPDPMIEYLTGE